MRSDETADSRTEGAQLSIEMLRAVIDGDTYETVAARFGVSRTAVERRVKSVAVRLTRVVGVEGLKEEGAAFVRRLRLHRDAILVALEDFEPAPPAGNRPARVLSPSEVAQGAVRIKGRTQRTWHDLALYYLLFATGLRPLEIARLEVRDYLHADGSVRWASALRPEAAINGKSRPLYFSSSRLTDSLDAYLRERCDSGHGLGEADRYRGLDPGSRLFLSPSGEPYRIVPNNTTPGQNRHVCRALLETYRKLFRYAGLKGLSAQSARLTLMSRMYERGGDEAQVGIILGIGERSAVRELLPRPRPTLAELLDELV
ncbi:site-specific integrase [Pseudothauera nasutitermitis]|uniref:Site-specific integrase n=1 Tax=Pseudothauera nasutitermitis TaxID=2565930 RepID=A0A4V3WBX9_9RHOO|nr:site-specific integrase [Pseudothauera nasutitermitis]THF64969.1 site-specific integrase [Pseudothauera nasutitermitis]